MLLRFTLRQLEYFVAVGEMGSIALASEKVGVSSPSISSVISQLESGFGLQLFIRKHAHGLSLTQGGRQFLVQAKKVLATAEEMNGLASNISGHVQGPLNVGCLSTFAQLVLPQLRRRFEAKFPQVRIKQSELHQAAIFECLQNAEIDIALTYDLNTPSDITFVPMLKLPLYAMLSISHPLAARAQLSPEDLADFPMILLDIPFSADYFLSFFHAAGLKPNVTERTQDMAVMRSLVANDYGYALANIRTFSDRSPDGNRLKFIPLTGSLRPLQLGIAYSKATHMTRTVQAFLDHCFEVVSSGDVPGLHVMENRSGTQDN
ncbi:MAG: LysR family transcriptional regulator [Proteobacteria bacterium]|nr:LysR family transcriptional regulator [Pseudomonadota bacterium]